MQTEVQWSLSGALSKLYTTAQPPNPKLIEIDISSNGQNFKIL
jgi:hypothetical protein